MFFPNAICTHGGCEDQGRRTEEPEPVHPMAHRIEKSSGVKDKRVGSRVGQNQGATSNGECRFDLSEGRQKVET